MNSYQEKWKMFLMEQKEKNFSSAHVVIIKDNQVLLLKRSADDMWAAGKWGLPGGKKEEGETPEENVCRECKEETQLTLDPENLIYLSGESNASGEHAFFTISEYSGDIKIDHEHDDFDWYDLDKLEEVDTVPGLKKIIKEAEEKTNER